MHQLGRAETPGPLFGEGMSKSLKEQLRDAIASIKAARDALDGIDDSLDFEEIEEELEDTRNSLGLIQGVLQDADKKVKDPSKLKIVSFKKVLNCQVVVPSDMSDEDILANFQFHPNADNFLGIWLNPGSTDSPHAGDTVSIEDNMDWTETWESSIEDTRDLDDGEETLRLCNNFGRTLSKQTL